MSAIIELAMTDAVLAVDIGGQFTYVNRSAETLTGRSRADLLGKPLTSVFWPDHVAPAHGACRLSQRAMEESRYIGPATDWFQCDRDGRREVTCYATPIRNRYGLTSGAVIVARATTSSCVDGFCECYRVVRDEFDRLLHWHKGMTD